MDGYLLDTNVFSILLDERHENHEKVKDFIASQGESLIFISIVSLSEIEYGLKTAPSMDPELQKIIHYEISKINYRILEIDRHIVTPLLSG